uniref:Uncharacterized protein n=1 Tax=Panagrolaimus sp. ES5 TaxID=591445 RepID=A0AC34G194_9BILA
MPTAAKIPWPGGPSMKQNFPFPDTVIYYVSMNPSSPKAYNKMIQSCKFFFETNPILFGYDAVKICSKYLKNIFHNPNFSCLDIDMKKCISKFWLIHKLYIDGDENEIPNFTSLLCSKLYRCDLKILELSDQNILFDDFKLLVSSVKTISLYNVKTLYKDGKVVMLEAIFESIPNIDKFSFQWEKNFSMVTAETLKNISELKSCERLITFELSYIPDIFKVEELSDFIMNHKTTKIIFAFSFNISEEYKIQLDSLIDTVIEAKIIDVIIDYRGQDEEKLLILENQYADSDDDE